MRRQSPVGHTVRDLVVWQKAMTLAEVVYRVTRSFPAEERFGLVVQTRRAAISVAANIAEGHGRHSAAYFAQFLGVAQGSALELETELELAYRLGFIDDAAWDHLRDLLDHVGRLLMNLRRAVRRKPPTQK